MIKRSQFKINKVMLSIIIKEGRTKNSKIDRNKYMFLPFFDDIQTNLK